MCLAAYGKALQARRDIAAMYAENIQRLTENMNRCQFAISVCLTVCLCRPAEGRPVTSMELVVRSAKESSDDFYDMQFLEVASRASGQILSGFFPTNNFCQGFVSKKMFGTITACDWHSLSHNFLLHQFVVHCTNN